MSATAPPDGPLTEVRLVAALSTRWLGRRAQCLAVCDSTNDVVTRAARQGAEAGLLVVAEAQERGRGRQGRSWVAPPGANLTFSLLARFTRPVQELPRVTLVAGVAVAEALGDLGIDAGLKWPNDVLLPDAAGGWRKVAGILTEMTTEGTRTCPVVLGIGLNVNVESFPAELAGRATSLRLARGGEPWDRAVVLAAILGRLETALEEFERSGLPALGARWERLRAAVLPYRAENEEGLTVEGWQHGLDVDGALLLRDREGRLHRVLSGELEVAAGTDRG